LKQEQRQKKFSVETNNKEKKNSKNQHRC